MLPIIIPISAAEPRWHVKDIALAATDNIEGADKIALDTDRPFLLTEIISVSSLETLTDELHKKHEIKVGLQNKQATQFCPDGFIKSRQFSDARNSGRFDGPFIVLNAGTILKLDVKNTGGANASTISVVVKGFILKDKKFWAAHGITW